MAARILFFESDSKFAAAVRSELEARGASVNVIDDGNDGLHRAASERPDLILLTIELPQMNGFLVCKKLKKNPETSSIPVLILSSESTEEIFEQHRKLRTRAEDYIRKPIEVAALMERVGAHVPLGAAKARLSVSDDAVEIPFDEVEEIVESTPPAKVEAEEHVDDEIEAFAESAFDALVMGEGEEETTGVSAIPAEVKAQRPKSVVPPPPPAGSAVDSKALDDARAETVKLRSIADAAKKAAEDAETKLARQMRENEQLAKEVSELQTKAAKGGGISSREFLDLREALNSKDREILDLRDQVSARDKQLIEHRDKNLALERERADFQDAQLELERAKGSLEERIEALTKETEDARQAIGTLTAKAAGLETDKARVGKDLEDQRAMRAADVARLEKAMAEAISTRDEALAVKEVEHSTALEQLKEETAATVSAAETKAAEEVAAAKAQAASDVEEARSEAASAVAKATGDAETAVATSRAEAEAAVDKATREGAAAVAAAEREAADTLAEARQEAAAALEAQKLAAAEDLAELRADQIKAIEKKDTAHLEAIATLKAESAAAREAALDKQREDIESRMNAEREAALSSLRDELTKIHQAAVAELKATQSQELAVLGRKMASTETELSAAQELVRSRGEELEQRERELEDLRRELDDAKASIASKTAEAQALNALKNELTQRVFELETETADLGARLAAAEGKIQGDEALLQRARKAFAIGLSLLEDQSNGASSRDS